MAQPTFGEGDCTSCGRAPSEPYRRYDDRGHAVEGCVDEAHTGHVFGESLRWHNRPAAKAIRKAMYNMRHRISSGGRAGR